MTEHLLFVSYLFVVTSNMMKFDADPNWRKLTQKKKVAEACLLCVGHRRNSSLPEEKQSQCIEKKFVHLGEESFVIRLKKCGFCDSGAKLSLTKPQKAARETRLVWLIRWLTSHTVFSVCQIDVGYIRINDYVKIKTNRK